MDVVLVAQVGNGFALNQMLANLLLRAKITSVVVVHRGLFFQPRLAPLSPPIFQFPLKQNISRTTTTD